MKVFNVALLLCVVIAVSSAGHLKEGKLKKLNVAIGPFHERAQKHMLIGNRMAEEARERSRAIRAAGGKHHVKDAILDLFIDVTQISFGLLDGISFDYVSECINGLRTMVGTGLTMFTIVQELYLPENFMKVAIYGQQITEAQGTIYAYCDVDHLYNIGANLIDYQNVLNIGQAWGEMGSRLIGGLFVDYWEWGAAATDAIAIEDYYTSGFYVAKFLGQIVDT